MTLLRQRMIDDMQIRNLSPHTQSSYVLQVSQLARHFEKSPDLLGPEDIRSYQVYLTNKKKAVASLDPRFRFSVALFLSGYAKKDMGL